MKLLTIDDVYSTIKSKLGRTGKAAFLSALFAGIITHMVALVNDIPNHDGLASVYFDQNMITSGRWFLMPACAISSFYSLPWLIGVLSILFLAITACLTVNILDIKNNAFAAVIGALMVTYPGLCGNFAYVFTMDGYTLGLLLCVSAVYVVKTFGKDDKFGLCFIPAGILLGTGMGTYQSYLCVAMLLCVYLCGVILLSDHKASVKLRNVLRYAAMGVTGVVFYYVMLRILLLIQHKQLADYQGIKDMASGNGVGILETIKKIYSDFIVFSVSGKVFLPNLFAVLLFAVLFITALFIFVKKAGKSGYLKKPLFYVFSILFILVIPCVTNAIMVISTDVTYHVLMRYQWILFPIFLLAIIDEGIFAGDKESGLNVLTVWLTFSAAALIAFVYIVTDNIAYSNLSKKYEKTYAYCVRLADRIEQTEGYYHGIPIAMVGVVGNDNFPTTDVTGDVTGNILGIGGDYLLYRGENYADFFKYYLGITFNILPDTYVTDFYNEDFYANMASFPDEGSTLVSDGILYVKTENVR